MEGYIGGIALPTNVTLGKCIPSMLCVVDVYLTLFTPSRESNPAQNFFMKWTPVFKWLACQVLKWHSNTRPIGI